MDAFLAGHGAQFCYLLDVDGMEGRRWNNDGLTEDVATGSAEHVQNVTVSGEVSFVGTARLDVVPAVETASGPGTT